MNFHVSSQHYREMGSIARTLHTRNDSRFAGLGLQKGQFVYLTRLCENPGTGVVKLAKLARVDQTTATKAVQKLETAGYVTKRPDPVDGRAQFLEPTARAREAWAAIVAAENDDLIEGLNGFNDADRELFLDFLVRVRSNLDGGRP
jgi:DNA-binding MarR family transcriptional regulator